jgi:hypothetical protein
MKTRILSFALFLPVVLTSQARGQAAVEKIVITERELEGFLHADAEALKLRETAAAARIFDLSLPREVDQELGIK